MRGDNLLVEGLTLLERCLLIGVPQVQQSGQGKKGNIAKYTEHDFIQTLKRRLKKIHRDERIG